MRRIANASATELVLQHKYLSTALLLLICLSGFSQDSLLLKMQVDADTLMGRQEYEGAIKLYSKIIAATGLKEKSQFKPLYKRAVAYYSLEESDSALTDMNRFIAEFPEVPQARILRALIYRQLQQVDNQLIDLEKAMSIQTDNVELLRWHATLLLEKNQYEKAKADLLHVKTYQDDAELETNLGMVYYSLGSFDSALVCLNSAIELDVMYPASYVYAGSFCLQEGKFQLALEYLNLGLRIDPSSVAAMFYKGVALVELNKTDEGCSCLRKAFEAGEDDAAGYLKEYCYEVTR